MGRRQGQRERGCSRARNLCKFMTLAYLWSFFSFLFFLPIFFPLPGGQWVDEGAWCLGSKAGRLESWSCIHPWHLLPTSQALFGALQYILAVYR